MRRFIPRAHIVRFLPAQEGTTAMEYAVIASGIAGILVAAVTTLGDTVTGMWSSVASLF